MLSERLVPRNRENPLLWEGSPWRPQPTGSAMSADADIAEAASR
jgi:hypothetical protein